MRVQIGKKLDLWSIIDQLDEMIGYDYNGNEKESIYWDYYAEQIQELANVAADLTNELYDIKDQIWYKMPEKKIAFCEEDESGQTAISWFNTVAATISDTDMTTLLENENIYNADEESEKAKRLNALGRLTKEQQTFIYSLVYGFIYRYMELKAAFDVIISVINELDYHQSYLNGKNPTAPQAAYL